VTTSRWKRMVQAVLPRPLERRLHDRLEAWRHRHPGAHCGLEEFGLPAAQVYPAGTNFDACLQAGLQPRVAGLTIGRSTPVASIGSCFADEFASYMRQGGFAYVTAESDLFPASANWGRVYTIPAFRQIVDYSIREDFPTAIEEGPDGWFDPLRDPIVGQFATPSEAESAIRAHRRASRRAFGEARVLIVTLGQNEAWVDDGSGLVWARVPPAPILTAQGRTFTAREFSFEDNVRWLEATLTSLRTLNPDLDVLLTVSPVASYATFCGAEAVTQSFAGKAVLRAVAERITRRMDRVWYFPAFEMTLAYNPHTLTADNRHVKNSTVDRILALLRTTVIRPDE
jgi:hypothetical protein